VRPITLVLHLLLLLLVTWTAPHWHLLMGCSIAPSLSHRCPSCRLFFRDSGGVVVLILGASSRRWMWIRHRARWSQDGAEAHQAEASWRADDQLSQTDTTRLRHVPSEQNHSPTSSCCSDRCVCTFLFLLQSFPIIHSLQASRRQTQLVMKC